MEIFKSAILGLIQGFTEFFPVSSSGHLIIFPYFFNWEEPSIFFAVSLHFATLIALLTVLYKDVWHIIRSFFAGIFIKKYRIDSDFKLALYIIIASIPAAIVGYLFNDLIESLFLKPVFAALFLIITAIILISFELIGKKKETSYAKANKTSNKISWLSALVIGIGQAVAIIPGISRSGSTISSARIFGIKREEAVKFSFLISIPVIFGSFVFEMIKGIKTYIITASSGSNAICFIVTGFIAAYVSGLFAVKFLLKFSEKRNLNIFAIYCVLVSLVFFIVYFIRK